MSYVDTTTIVRSTPAIARSSSGLHAAITDEHAGVVQTPLDVYSVQMLPGGALPPPVGLCSGPKQCQCHMDSHHESAGGNRASVSGDW